ncbi:uncharacterized protein I303_104171 [Kwoniella dejecticola CBS 10117]|uniref:Maltose/galactoside acetyltransferase domain-containing protein n=1 Tax=Kwoniella dejecticola CBS 10117 TaxID=1296121 RepID=A0A1A6A634_9TREE|nr:uncharacterized protein I303_04851 [Kwoniella dejecticola CBS 10117]OBR85515.1 hypothetical protein I303_04851 [Kwoniella dejecticola CBS 10117]
MPAPHETNPRISPPGEGEDATELGIMIAGKPYLAMDPYVDRIRAGQAKKVWEINQIVDIPARMDAMRGFLNMGRDVCIMQGFFCEYGFNITLGDEVFIGANCTFLDVSPIKIGSRTMLGPNVQILTPNHPIVPEQRTGPGAREWAEAITIGDDCWIGAGATICPGITIGDGVTIGASTVVTRDVPARCVVVGNPGRVIKRIKEDGTVEKA